MHRSVRMITAVTLAFLLGGPGAILQGLAWFSMAVSYSRVAPINVALQWTFDGKHPCQMCQLAKKANQESSHSETVLKVIRLDASAPQSPIAAPAAPQSPRPTFADVILPESTVFGPGVPPPRSLAS
jgi:hypothetical protein